MPIQGRRKARPREFGDGAASLADGDRPGEKTFERVSVCRSTRIFDHGRMPLPLGNVTKLRPTAVPPCHR